jgi:hypothetical protein
MAELLEATKKVVESFNQKADVPEINLTGGSVEDNLLFGAFPPVEAAAAKYHANVAQEHPEKILLPENLIDREQRAASRASLIRMRGYLAAYHLSIPEKSKDFILICGNDRAAVSDAMYRTFHRAQLELERERFDEIEALLAMMDDVCEATLESDTIVFPSVRQQEDFQRSLSRIRRLEALRTMRDRLLLQRLEKKPVSNFIKAPPGIWDFLREYPIVHLDGDSLTINGKSIILPVERAQLVSALGQPREIEGDPGRSVWDHRGIAAVYSPGTAQIETLVIALRPRPMRWWPKEMAAGRLTLLGLPVDENSTPWSLNRQLGSQKFVGDESGNEWTLALDGYTLKATFDLDGTIDSLTIHAGVPRP